MHHALPKALFAALALAALAGHPPASASAPPTQGQFGPGEVLTFRVRYGPVDTGVTKIVVGSERAVEARDTWPIVVRARTSPGFSRVFDVRDRFVTFWDPETQESLGFDFHVREGDFRRFTKARLDPSVGEARVELRDPGKAPRNEVHKIGPVAHDIASALFWLRAQPLKVNERYQVDVFTGKHAFVLGAKVEGTERLDTVVGERETLRLRLTTHFKGKLAAKRDIVLWMSHDEAHIPLAIEAELVLGSLRAELTQYLPGLARPKAL